jgi:hypothetical protein
MANRRERFKKLYPKRLKNAKWNIRSIGKLSERTNYVYEEEEVDEILSTLMFEIKAAISKFGSGSVEERFKRYIEIDLKQMKVIKETDPDLYKYILQRLKPKGASLLEDYLKDKKEKEDNLFSLSNASYDQSIAEIDNSAVKVYKIEIDAAFHLIEKMGQEIDALEEENKKQKKELESKSKPQQVDTKNLEEQIRQLHYLLDRNNDLVLQEIKQIKAI